VNAANSLTRSGLQALIREAGQEAGISSARDVHRTPSDIILHPTFLENGVTSRR